MRDSGGDAVSAAGGVAAVAAAAGSVAMLRGQMGAYEDDARAVAEAYGVELPDVRRMVVAMALVPLVAMAAARGLNYASAVRNMRASQAAAHEQFVRLTDAFEAAGMRAGGIDPASEYNDSGYYLTVWIPGEYITEIPGWGCTTDDEFNVVVGIDNDGQIDCTTYHARVDITKSLDENLTSAQTAFNTLGEALGASGADAEYPALLSHHTLSDDFCRQFLAGDMYTRLHVDDKLGWDYSISCSFETEEKDSFREYTKPTIYLTIG